MRQQAIDIVKEYCSELTEPTLAMNKGQFMHRSYCRFAADHILTLLRDSRGVSEFALLEQFARLVDSYACLKKENTFMFSAMYDTAIDIMDRLIENRNEEWEEECK